MYLFPNVSSSVTELASLLGHHTHLLSTFAIIFGIVILGMYVWIIFQDTVKESRKELPPGITSRDVIEYNYAMTLGIKVFTEEKRKVIEKYQSM